jgi:hypothetical protein
MLKIVTYQNTLLGKVTAFLDNVQGKISGVLFLLGLPV